MCDSKQQRTTDALQFNIEQEIKTKLRKRYAIMSLSTLIKTPQTQCQRCIQEV